MKRIHLFEFEDFRWFPESIRGMMTDYLQFVAHRLDIYKPAIPILMKGLQASGAERILDLGSGSGGGIMEIYRHLEREGMSPHITLSDLYPNVAAFREISAQIGGRITFSDSPVDATAVPPELTGLRLQLLSFHHFSPQMATRILQNAVDSGAAICIFEALERNWINFVSVLFSPLVVWVLTPFFRPFKWSRLFFTYPVPIVPFLVMWDGLVSVLRTYTAEEMLAMAQRAGGEKFHWEAGKVPPTRGPGVLYLLGYPTARH